MVNICHNSKRNNGTELHNNIPGEQQKTNRNNQRGTRMEDQNRIEREKKESRAKRIKHLFTKHKTWMSTQYKTARFQEPVLFLERRSGEVEFFEKATAGTLNFTHSDGTKRFIILTPNQQKKFGFADKRFRGYYCHEDIPTPLPQNPHITAEQVNVLIEKSLADINKMKVKELAAKGRMWGAILTGVAIIIAIIVVWLIAKPNPQVVTQTPQVIEVVREQVLNNASAIIQ